MQTGDCPLCSKWIIASKERQMRESAVRRMRGWVGFGKNKDKGETDGVDVGAYLCRNGLL